MVVYEGPKVTNCRALSTFLIWLWVKLLVGVFRVFGTRFHQNYKLKTTMYIRGPIQLHRCFKTCLKIKIMRRPTYMLPGSTCKLLLFKLQCVTGSRLGNSSFTITCKWSWKLKYFVPTVHSSLLLAPGQDFKGSPGAQHPQICGRTPRNCGEESIHFNVKYVMWHVRTPKINS